MQAIDSNKSHKDDSSRIMASLSSQRRHFVSQLLLWLQQEERHRASQSKSIDTLRARRAPESLCDVAVAQGLAMRLGICSACGAAKYLCGSTTTDKPLEKYTANAKVMIEKEISGVRISLLIIHSVSS